MRIVKEPSVRREEIIRETVKLFAEKGYVNTSVNDILAAVNVAKGTFYYYFKSKESLLDAAIETFTERLSRDLNRIAAADGLDAIDKFVAVIAQASNCDDAFKRQIIKALHQQGNELLHEKSLIVATLSLVPILTRIVEEGNAQGLFCVEYPRTAVETLLIASQFMFDERFFGTDAAGDVVRLKEFVSVVETVLGVRKDTLSALANTLAGDAE